MGKIRFAAAMSHVLDSRRRAFAVAVAALVLSLAGTPALAQKPRDAVTLRLDFYAYGLHAPFAYGVEKGIYAEQGIDLTILEGNGSGATVQQVGAGTDRFGFADATAMARLVSKGLPAKMIANYVQTSPLAIIFFADKDIKAPKDLEGRTIAFTAGDAIHQLFPAFVNVTGLDKAKVQEVLLVPAAKQTAVMTGTVDAMSGFYNVQAAVIEHETKRPVRYLRYADYGLGSITHGLVVNTRSLGDVSLNCRMVKATSLAWAAAAKDPDGAADALLRLFPKTNKGSKELTKRQWVDNAGLLYSKVSQGKAPGFMVREDWERLIALAKDYGGLEPVKPLDDYYTNEFFDCR
jgi:NitT/TauT family transport system substrate-binding protein